MGYITEDGFNIFDVDEALKNKLLKKIDTIVRNDEDI